MKKIVCIVSFATTLILVLSGCSSPSSNEDAQEPAPTPKDQPAPKEDSAPKEAHKELEVTNTGYGPISTDMDHPYSSYGFAVSFKNPNEAYEIKNPVIHIVGKDEGGNVIYTDDQTVPFILPDDEYTYAGKMGNGDYIPQVEFSVSCDDGNYAECDKKDPGLFTIANTSDNNNGAVAPTFTGDITMNTEWEGIHKALVCVSLKDQHRSDVFVGGYSAMVDIPEAGKAVPFTIDSPGITQHDSYEITAIPWE